MKLTKTHIQQLYKFTRQHYVYHYDVQSELVDHLANDIEQIWEENPNLSFEDARDKSFKKFGIFGFMDVIDAKQKQMNKRYWKIIWRFLKEWFTAPKIAITTFMVIVLFFVLRIQYSEYVLLGTLFILALFDTITQVKARKKIKKKEAKKEKIFLLEAMIGETRQGFSGLTFINLFNLVNLTRFNFSSLDDYWLLLISFSAIILILLFYITAYIIPQKAQELLQETYPEYKMVKNL